MIFGQSMHRSMDSLIDRCIMAACCLHMGIYISLGKTHIARRIAKYLSFFHAMPVQLFNASEYRRKLCGSITDEEWFDVTNEEVKAMRRACNEAVIVDILDFLDKHVNGVVLLDSTNPDHSRRINLLTKVLYVMWIS